MTQPIRVAVVDDHHLFRKGIIPLINEMDAIEVVFDSAEGGRLLAYLEQHPVDIVLLDLEMPGMDGSAVTEKVKAQFPEVGVIILSAYEEEVAILRLVELGAKGYLLKDAKVEELEMAIHSVMENGFYFNDRISNLVINGLVEKQKLKSKFNPEVVFSDKELEILTLTCQDLTNAEIAAKVFLSQRTVEGHRQKMLEKIGARSKVGLVVYALEHKLVDLNK